MSVALIVTMGSISVGCAVTEKILTAMGKSDHAQMVGISGMAGIGMTALACVVKLFGEIKKL